MNLRHVSILQPSIDPGIPDHMPARGVSRGSITSTSTCKQTCFGKLVPPSTQMLAKPRRLAWLAVLDPICRMSTQEGHSEPSLPIHLDRDCRRLGLDGCNGRVGSQPWRLDNILLLQELPRYLYRLSYFRETHNPSEPQRSC